MKLLLIDKAGLATFAREEILQDQFHHRVDYAFSYNEFKAKYRVGLYRVVIVDFALEFGAKALEEIDRLDAKQRVIILSESEAYSEPNGCAYCVAYHNRRRLKEPVSVMELGSLIRDFDYTNCAYYHD